MSTWLTAWRNREDPGAADSIIELLVVAGADAGDRFTLEGEEILIGRGEPESGQVGVIRLNDRSISRRQAWIRRDAEGTFVEHIPGAANPLRVNGAETGRARLAVGDRIELGRVAIEVRARPGLNLTGLNLSGLDATELDPAAEGELRGWAANEKTELRPMPAQFAELVLLRGPDGLTGARYRIHPGVTLIGRGGGAQIRIPELGVSRVHVELALEGRNFVLIPRSGTNPTLVNGFVIEGRTVLAEGDEIQLADRVVLGLRFAGSVRDAERPAAVRALGLAYSEVLDLAGHIQKCAEPDTLVISEATLEALPRRIAVTEVSDPRGDAGRLFRVDGRVRAADLAAPDPTQLA